MSDKISNYKTDHRAATGGWCDGEYMCKCFSCGSGFIGDKRALVCADCAYSTPVERFAKFVLDKVKERTADFGGDENDDELLELAAKLGYGNVRRVKYDPDKHGTVIDAEPGQEVWFWGEAKP